MLKRVKGVLVGVVPAAVGVLVPALAMAEPSFSITPPEIDYVGLGTYATAILGGLAAIWLIRKYVKLTNRS